MTYMKEDWKNYFSEKKITVMGLGLLGRGVGDSIFLAEMGAELIVTDLKTKEELRESVERLKDFDNITFALGEHRLEDFQSRDFILKAAGVPDDSLYLEEARRNNIPIKMSASWFAELCEIPIIGITGTRGKSTTTHLLHEVLEAAGKRVLLGGNVRGVATLPLLRGVHQDSIALFELDSWQLQGFGESEISPHISVFTTFLPDHMSYYKNDMASYFADKANIYKSQSPDDFLIVGESVEEKVLAESPEASVTVARADDISNFELNLKGGHNKLNASCVYHVASILHIEEDIVRQAFKAFKGVPGRLEYIKETDGISFYNDTTATTPEATLAALDSFDEKIILLIGGADKDLNMNSLLSALPENVSYAVVLPGTGTDTIIDSMSVPYIQVKSMQEAVEKSFEKAKELDAKEVVLSPGFASFGLFKNEFDRGDQFNEAVQKL